MTRPLAKNLLVCVVALLLIAVAAEVCVVLFFPQNVVVTSAENIFFMQYDAEIGWVNKAGSSGPYRSNDRAPLTHVRINALGYRGTPVAMPKPSGASRIVFLGDSNTFGYGVEEDQRFSDILLHSLPSRFDGANLGVFGFGTDQALLLFERIAGRLEPDMVILGFSAGDLSDNMNSAQAGFSKPFFSVEDGDLTLRNTPVPRSVSYLKEGARRSEFRRFLYAHSHLFRLIQYRLTASHVFMPDSVQEMSRDEGMRTTIAILERLAARCRSMGSRLIVVLIPHGMWVASDSRGAGPPAGYFPFLRGALDQAGIPVVDMTRRLVAAHRRGEEVFFRSDPVHLSPGGHAVVAAVLREELTRRGFPEISGADPELSEP